MSDAVRAGAALDELAEPLLLGSLLLSGALRLAGMDEAIGRVRQDEDVGPRHEELGDAGCRRPGPG